MSQDKRTFVKVIPLGDAGSGKTSFVHRLVYGKFPYNTLNSCMNCDFFYKEIDIKHNIDCVEHEYKMALQLWDTAGQERFQSLGVAYYRGTDCAIIMYDISNRKSFQRVELWLHELLEGQAHYHELESNKKISIAIVGNKLDLNRKREVTTQEL